MEGKNVGVGVAAEAAKQIAPNLTPKEADNLARSLAERFGMAVEHLTSEKLASSETVQYQLQGKWVTLSVYLHNSSRVKLNQVPEKRLRGVLASYLDTPYKIRDYPTNIGHHWFRVVALLPEKQVVVI